MALERDSDVGGRLREYLIERLGRHLGRREQRESFALYAHGIVGEGERKSVEPIAARATGEAAECERVQARLLNFLRDSPWAYEELKGELGLDHFEGRSFPGWHHHVSVVLCCYAFIVSERLQCFPPSTEGGAFSYAA